jgi:hypothetical protein
MIKIEVRWEADHKKGCLVPAMVLGAVAASDSEGHPQELSDASAIVPDGGGCTGPDCWSRAA